MIIIINYDYIMESERVKKLVIAISSTVTKSSALKCCFLAFAAPPAFFLAPTTNQLSACLCSFWHSCPKCFPSPISVLLIPPPVSWRGKFWSCNHQLGPAVTSLVDCPFDVLNKCSGSRSIVLPFFVKSSFLASFTHSRLLVRSY